MQPPTTASPPSDIEEQLPIVLASPEIAMSHRRWQEPPADPQQLGDFRRALSETMGGLERQIRCATDLNLAPDQINALSEEHS
eukprot:8657016-Pyramimonas_sp.AAC.1